MARTLTTEDVQQMVRALRAHPADPFAREIVAEYDYWLQLGWREHMAVQQTVNATRRRWP